MNKNIKKTNLSSDNLTFLRSVSKETKEHFDSLLKKALHKNDKQKKDTNNENRSKILQKNKLVEESKFDNDDDDDDDDEEYFDVKESPTKKNFILEKFLSDAVNSKKESDNNSPKKNVIDTTRKLLISSVTFIKNPISPSKSKSTQDEDEDKNLDNKIEDKHQDDKEDNNLDNEIKDLQTDEKSASPVSNQGTYSVSSPVLHNRQFMKDFDKLSTCSRHTYNVTEPKIVEAPKNSSNGSRGTYNLYTPDKKKRNTETKFYFVDSSESEFGGVGTIINNPKSPKSKSVVKEVNTNKIIDCTSIDNAKDNASKQSNRSLTLHYENENFKNPTINPKLEEDNAEKHKDTEDPVDMLSKYEAVNLKLKKETQAKKVKRARKKAKEIASNDEASSFRDILYTYEDLLGVIVYKTDKLQLNSLITHPCVKIHVVDSETGEYLRRSKEIYSGDNLMHSIKYVYPLITKSYELQQNRSLIPFWEELVVFNEDYEYFIDYKDSIIIFFEILDFISFSDASSRYKKEGSSSGWHKVAWAFLKLVGNTGELNVGEKIRLQLYRPKKTLLKKSQTECILYDWWSRGALVKYPSTIHISVKKVKADSLKDTKHSDAVFKSQLGLDIIEKETIEENEPTDTSKEYEQNIQWSRMYNQRCKIPNQVYTKLKSASKGCFAVKFSNNGLWVACGVAAETKHPIIIYYVLDKQRDTLREYCKLAGHQGIIYNIIWTSDDKYLISSSADCTTYIWNVFRKHYHPKQVLPHPSFVYCALINQELIHIATGCYDQVLRIWRSTKIDSKYELFQELEGHSGYITSLSFGESEHILYSADSSGIIKEWSYNNKDWSPNRTFKFQELHRTIINNIVLHPGGKRMVVFCRDSTHRMIDLVVGCIIQWYRGTLNYRVHTNGCLSPCGNLVFAPSEDGAIFVWNIDTGALLTTYTPFSNNSNEVVVPHYIHYHPLEHFIVVSHYGAKLPILICCFAKSSNIKMKTPIKSTEKKSTIDNNKKPKIPVKIKPKTAGANRSNRSENNLSFNVIIDKIDDVLVSAKSN